jgi:GT2 family glycosyltransferase
VLIVEFFRYVKDRLTKRNVTLTNLVDLTAHHGSSEAKSDSIARISIIIPTRDKSQLLKNCIDSVRKTTSDLEIELVVVDNDSVESETKAFLKELADQGAVVLEYPGKFNYSAICNLAASNASGDYLCFLNNDTEVVSPTWLSSMVQHASQKSVGLVGAVLVYPDNTIQHMGISLGYAGSIAGHPYRGKSAQENVPDECFEVSGVTFACAVISKSKFDGLNGLDEVFPVGFNDVDISIRALDSNFYNVVCTRAVLTHAESQSRPKGKSLKGFFSSVSDVITFLRMYPSRNSDRFFQKGVPVKEIGQRPNP